MGLTGDFSPLKDQMRVRGAPDEFGPFSFLCFPMVLVSKRPAAMIIRVISEVICV